MAGWLYHYPRYYGSTAMACQGTKDHRPRLEISKITCKKKNSVALTCSVAIFLQNFTKRCLVARQTSGRSKVGHRAKRVRSWSHSGTNCVTSGEHGRPTWRAYRLRGKVVVEFRTERRQFVDIRSPYGVVSKTSYVPDAEIVDQEHDKIRLLGMLPAWRWCRLLHIIVYC